MIHGLGGSPDNHWFPWLSSELEARNFKVESLKMPEPKKPTLQNWLSEIDRVVGKPTENDFFVGHSLGCVAIVRWLEKLTPGEKIGGAVFVAGFSGRVSVRGTETFWKDPVDFEKVKSHAPDHSFVTIFSEDDRIVPLNQGLEFQNNLGAKLILENGKGHFCQSDGVTELPSVLESLSSF